MTLNEKTDLKDEESKKAKTIKYIEIGKHRCETWYYSPFPNQYQNIDTLYICEFCLDFYLTKTELFLHDEQCLYLHPLGNEIYRDQNLSVFEVDGSINSIYCENLSFIAKLFIDHKSLEHSVECFVYYIITEVDQYGCHLAGYFSKEKGPKIKNNLSCILVMPFYQRKGYGKFMVSLSYELSKIEKNIGTPERPLSQMGNALYSSWWIEEIIKLFEGNTEKVFSLQEISQKTFIDEDDIMNALEKLKVYNNGSITFSYTEKILEAKNTFIGKTLRIFDINKLHWVPFCYNHFIKYV